MYVGVFDLQDRLAHMKKILKEKKHLQKLLQEEIVEPEKDIKKMEEML